MRLINTALGKIGAKAGYETAQERADKLGCSRVHLLNIERGRAGASEALIGRMAGAYGVPREKIREAIRKSRKHLAQRIAESL